MRPGGPAGAPPGGATNPRDGFGTRTPGTDAGISTAGGFPPGNFRSPIPDAPGTSPSRSADVVPLTNVVSMVQERFNATAVKTDTVVEDDQMVYRIRLLSADKSRVWTVRVNAHTGQVK